MTQTLYAHTNKKKKRKKQVFSKCALKEQWLPGKKERGEICRRQAKVNVEVEIFFPARL
jgi:hypothetical protein